MKFFVPVACWMAIASSALAQNVWHVDASALGPGDGSAANPFPSLQQAVQHAAVVTGDTLRIAPGVYHENVALGMKGLRLVSSDGPLVTEVRAAAPGAVIDTPFFGPLVEVEGLTIRGNPLLASDGVAGGNVVVRRCILCGHRAPTSAAAGSGVHSKFDLWLENCTVYDNVDGVSLNAFLGVAYMSNSIVVGNAQEDVVSELAFTVSTASHCLWRTGAEHGKFGVGAGNLDLDPSLWELASGDVALKPNSPCIDAGDPNAPLDPDGTRSDIGALVFDPTYAPGPDVYCTAKINSLGCTPSISASGLASATSGAPFTIACVNELNQRPGLLFYGFEPHDLAFQGGWLCVRPPTRRTPVQDSGGSIGVNDCSGVYSLDLNPLIQAGLDPALQPGALVYAQFWSRDPGASFNTNRSDAVRFGVAP